MGINKIVALRIALDNEAEVVVGDGQEPDWGLLLAQLGEAIIDNSIMTLKDIKARQGSSITLRNTGTLTTAAMGADEGNGGRAGMGSVFYGDGTNTFISTAGTTKLPDDGGGYSDAIISTDTLAEGTPELVMSIGGHLDRNLAHRPHLRVSGQRRARQRRHHRALLGHEQGFPARTFGDTAGAYRIEHRVAQRRSGKGVRMVGAGKVSG